MTHRPASPQCAARADIPPHNSELVELDTTARRRILKGAGSLAAGGMLGPALTSTLVGCASPGNRVADAAPGFKPVPTSTADKATLPVGYQGRPLAAWGEPVGVAGAMPAWRPDASNSAADQALQIGMHHGGLQYVPLDGSRRGLLVMNHGGCDDGLLHVRGNLGWSADKVRKAQAAHGLSVVEIELKGGAWQMVQPSRWARRVTASTPLAISGPAAGHALLKTAADPAGQRVLGSLSRGAVSTTPWGTCLVAEEGYADHFCTADQPTRHERRYGLRRTSTYRWHEFDDRWDTVRHPQEPNRHGWVVEIDPTDPAATPVKRTALGRGAFAGAWATRDEMGRAVVYSADCGEFEYLYKFVSRDVIQPAARGQSAAQANAQLLDHGSLYVARFDADGTGRWLPLAHGSGPLTPAQGFADQAAVLVGTRQAADLLGATRMDNPEALAHDAASGWVYLALGHNTLRGTPGQPAVDAANPRRANSAGHILRWREGAADSGRYTWNHLLLAGDPAAAQAQHTGNVTGNLAGNIKGDAFACPSALALDTRGGLWIGTGVPRGALGKGEMAGLGNNQLLACNPASAEVRRFLTGPVHSELAGATFTPDGRTLFVNVRHPGASPQGLSDPGAPRRYSNWPDYRPEGRPRSATLAIRRNDGCVIGS